MAPNGVRCSSINTAAFKLEPVRLGVVGYLWPRTEQVSPPVTASLTDRLHKVQEQVERLVRDHKSLRERAAVLEAAGHDHQRTSEVLTARVAELERENEVLRKAKPAPSVPSVPGTKERIDELVNEIDRCLELIQD